MKWADLSWRHWNVQEVVLTLGGTGSSLPAETFVSFCNCLTVAGIFMWVPLGILNKLPLRRNWEKIWSFFQHTNDWGVWQLGKIAPTLNFWKSASGFIHINSLARYALYVHISNSVELRYRSKSTCAGETEKVAASDHDFAPIAVVE